jgi:hypothetical protein
VIETSQRATTHSLSVEGVGDEARPVARPLQLYRRRLLLTVDNLITQIVGRWSGLGDRPYVACVSGSPGGVRIDGTAEYLTAIQNAQFFLPHYYNTLFASLLLLIYPN